MSYEFVAMGAIYQELDYPFYMYCTLAEDCTPYPAWCLQFCLRLSARCNKKGDVNAQILPKSC